MSTEDFIWTGNWPDAREFLDRVGYKVPFLGVPAVRICPDYSAVLDDRGGLRYLHVDNWFAELTYHAEVGDTIRWYSTTCSFSVVARG